MMKKLEISKIIEFTNTLNELYTFVGNEKDEIYGFSSIFEYKPNTITWVRSNSVFDDKMADYLQKPIALLIAPLDFKKEKECLNCIMTEDPHRIFFSILKEFYSEKEKFSVGTNNTISPSAKISKGVSLGYNCFIGDRVEIGEGTQIYNNVVIHHDVKIGQNCLIQSGAVIGEDGFGFLTRKDGARERVVHLGSVTIGDNVEIGANTCISRGVMGDTMIGNGSKIDNLCHIAHNVKIGKNAFVVAHTMVGGSVNIGDNCWVASAVIRNGIIINEGVMVGLGAVVVKDVEAGSVVVGNPAKKFDNS
jgi:UDP-3-O-[3-hydroxymyristoyl] glucosamine N-acyltransferase